MGFFDRWKGGGSNAPAAPAPQMEQAPTVEEAWKRQALERVELAVGEKILSREQLKAAGVVLIGAHADRKGISGAVIPEGRQEASMPKHALMDSGGTNYEYGHLDSHSFDAKRSGTGKNIFTELPGGSIVHRSQIELDDSGDVHAQVVNDFDERGFNTMQRLFDGGGQVRIETVLVYGSDGVLQSELTRTMDKDGVVQKIDKVRYEKRERGWTQLKERDGQEEATAMTWLIGSGNDTPPRSSLRVNRLRRMD